MKDILVGIGNVYVETNYLGLETAGENTLIEGKEYRAATYETRVGGSVVNFVLQAKALGARVALIGKRGQDEMGNKLVQLLDQQNISSDLIKASPDVATSVDTGVVFAHSANNIQFVAGDANQKLSRADIDLNNPVFDEVQAVYLGGFLKQTSLYEDYPSLLKDLRDKGVRIFLDHGRIPVDATQKQLELVHDSLAFVEGYLPNEEELFGVTGEKDLDGALKKALSLGPKFVAVKLGEKGCRVKSETEDISIEGHSVDAVTTVGAGDSFNAGFVTQYLRGKNLEESGRFANTTAAIKVSRNVYPNPTEVTEFLR